MKYYSQNGKAIYEGELAAFHLYRYSVVHNYKVYDTSGTILFTGNGIGFNNWYMNNKQYHRCEVKATRPLFSTISGVGLLYAPYGDWTIEIQ